MISQTLEQTMKKTMEIESMIGRKVSGYYPLSRISNSDGANIRLQASSSQEPDVEMSEYIVENPDDIVSIFSFKKYEKTDLPFFKSISKKMMEI